MQTKQELTTILSAVIPWLPHHLPQSTGQAFGSYRSIVTYDTVRDFPGVLVSGLYEADVYNNLDHPHSPLVIFRSTILEKNPPGSGVLASRKDPYEALDFLRFHHGKTGDWHGCAESQFKLEEKVNSGRWNYSGTLI
jgi:hypothetical protein